MHPCCTLCCTTCGTLYLTAPSTSSLHSSPTLRLSPYCAPHHLPSHYLAHQLATSAVISPLHPPSHSCLTTHAHHYDYPCRLPTVLAGRQARQDARRHLRAAGAAERHIDRRQQEACPHRRRPGCRGATGQGGGRGGEPRKAREAPRGRVIYFCIKVLTSSALHVLLRFKTATVQFRQESYGAYRPRPAAQLLSVHPG